MVGRLEIAKDTVQVVTESAATHIGRIATILSGAVVQVTHEVGEWASDVFEMRDAAARARAAGPGRAASDSDDDFDDDDDFTDGDADDPAGDVTGVPDGPGPRAGT